MPATLPLYRAQDARAIDRRAIEGLGVPAFELMSRAGAAAWRLLRERWPQARRIGVACGPGNNGGDGYVLARLAHEGGCRVELVALQPPRTAEARQAAAEWQAAGGRTQVFEAGLPEVDLWVDALFGIGLTRAPEGAARELIEAINAAAVPVLALDTPSGVDADGGHVPGAAVRATSTLCFIAAKRGLHTGAALDHVGEVVLDPLALPPTAFEGTPPAARLLRPAALQRWLPRRARDSHKGRYGHVLCVGGDLGLGGAVRLCAEAALRAGAGLVSVATRTEHVAAILAARPEAMTRGIEDAGDFTPLLERASVLALGPGLGLGDWGWSLWTAALRSGKPAVLDADALNLLAGQQTWALPAGCVLTPHPGEAARLLDAAPGEIQRDRFAAAEALAAQYGAVVVLKGAGTVVAAPEEVPCVIAAGNPGMASGGMGDVLTGTIAALLAQGLSAFDAACAGALLHAAAGDAAAREGGERGLLPSDLFAPLRRLANPHD
ncbi:MAG: NAD(P)H-hydrate dehydratase [Rehaibacterium terrae]|uniref:NAD(P)H-hydrate dehydratase n=1 Tax=Rehaibacterium terrae TaxID=1341696 RepID=UPI003918B715